MTPDKQTKLTWRRKAWCDEFGCGLSYSYKLEREGVIKTVRLGPKMTLIRTPPAEALMALAARNQAA
jgi:hypothetical protein